MNNELLAQERQSAKHQIIRYLAMWAYVSYVS